MVKLAISIFHGHWPAVDSLGLWIFKYLGASGYIWIKVYLGALTRGTLNFFCDFMGIFPTSASHSSSQYGNLFFGTKIPKIRPLLTILNWLYSQKCEDPSPLFEKSHFWQRFHVSCSLLSIWIFGHYRQILPSPHLHHQHHHPLWAIPAQQSGSQLTKLSISMAISQLFTVAHSIHPSVQIWSTESGGSLVQRAKPSIVLTVVIDTDIRISSTLWAGRQLNIICNLKFK